MECGNATSASATTPLPSLELSGSQWQIKPRLCRIAHPGGHGGLEKVSNEGQVFISDMFVL